MLAFLKILDFALVLSAQAEFSYSKICTFSVCRLILICWDAEFAAACGLRTCLLRSSQRSLFQLLVEKSLQLGKYCKKRLSKRGHVFASVILAFCKHSHKQPFVCTVKQSIAKTIRSLCSLGCLKGISEVWDIWTNRIKLFDYHEISLTSRNGKENLKVLQDLW